MIISKIQIRQENPADPGVWLKETYYVDAEKLFLFFERLLAISDNVELLSFENLTVWRP